jgi:UDP-glucose 4-epimerase
VEDLAEGNVMALQPVAENKVYNLDGREGITIKQIAETVGKLVGDVKIEYTAARPGDFSGKRVSSARAERELGWQPKVSFEEGVGRYLDWFRAREVQNETEWARVHDSLKGTAGS